MHKCTAGSRNTLSRNQQLLKNYQFSPNAVADRLGRKYTMSAYRNVLKCGGLFGCDWQECRHDRYWLSCFFYWSCQWYLNWLVRKRKTCGSEVLYELADLLRKCNLTWTRTVGFVSDSALAVINQSKCRSRIKKDRI